MWQANSGGFPDRPLSWAGVGARPPLGVAVRCEGGLCAVRFCTFPTLFTSGCRASEGLLCLDPGSAGCLWLCPLKLQRPCTSAVAPSILIKVQRDLAVTTETSSPLFQDGHYLCSYLLLHRPAECGKC